MPRAGILLLIEAEDTMELNHLDVQEAITSRLEHEGVAVSDPVRSEGRDGEWVLALSLQRGGYLVARAWPKHRSRFLRPVAACATV